jgi:hypothetical protein
MPAMIRTDTLEFARSLAEAGMDRRQAEAIVQGLSEADTSDFATKADSGEIRADIADVRAEIAAVRAEMGGQKGEIFRFMYLQAMGIVGLTVGLTVTLIKLLP